MNDPLLVITKLEELTHMAVSAERDIDRAAVFGAVRALIDDLDKAGIPTIGENIERARWSICAILGYDVTNGHSNEKHQVWAMAALGAIRREFRTA